MKKYFLFSLCCLFFMVTACGGSSDTSESGADSTDSENQSSESSAAKIEKLGPKAFMTKFENAEGALLIDIRTPEEVANGSIPGAQFIDFYSEDFKDQVAKLDNSKPVFVYCASGGRSGKSMVIFKKAGFSEIYDLDGGFNDYRIVNIGKDQE